MIGKFPSVLNELAQSMSDSLSMTKTAKDVSREQKTAAAMLHLTEAADIFDAIGNEKIAAKITDLLVKLAKKAE